MESSNGIKVLVVGASARDHVMVNSCVQSSLVSDVFAAPGNAGMPESVKILKVDLNDEGSLKDVLDQNTIDLVIIGSKRALTAGLADICHEKNILVFGPNKAQSELETSELYLKKFLTQYNIPTANWAYFTNTEAALRGLKKERYPAVIKVSGLPAGRNVSIVGNYEEAESTVNRLTEEHVFGEEDQWLLIENYLIGEPISINLIISNDNYQILPFCKCYKRIGENNTGPNTPGMGAYAPTGFITPDLEAKITRTIIEPFMKGLVASKTSYTGALYIGVMLTRNGPSVFDVKVRFGDPECQTIVPLVNCDFMQLIIDAAKGNLKTDTTPLHKKYSVTVCKALTGYPEKEEKNEILRVLSIPDDTISVIHASTIRTPEATVQTKGGRPLSITACSDNLLLAISNCYAACEQTAFNAEYYRKDIGTKEIQKKEMF